jgi:hypothetical protein
MGYRRAAVIGGNRREAAVMRKVVLALAVVALLACAGLAAAAGGTKPRVIGSASASGAYAIALANGSTEDPRALFVRVRSRPRQHVDGAWTVVCHKKSAERSRSGDIHGRTPLRRRLRLPSGHPSDCAVSATAQLARSGRITVELLARP